MKTKGRGIIQLTGDGNYKAANEQFDWGKFTVVKGKDGKERKVFTSWDLLDKAELAAEPDRAFPIAGWFWSEQKPLLIIEEENLWGELFTSENEVAADAESNVFEQSSTQNLSLWKAGRIYLLLQPKEY